MPSLFSRLKGKDGPTKVKSKKNGAANNAALVPSKPAWEDAYTRTTVEPEEIDELVKLCTEELKARALDIPFLLLPFRPTSDPSAVRTFVRHFFDHRSALSGESLLQELRMTEPMVISGVIKWCWSRLQGGVVGWDAYELFKIGEQDSNGARDSFNTFIPLSIENPARSSIVFSFFDLMAAIAAHGKANGFGGRKLSRMASWWAFEAKDTSNGFEGGYKDWLKAADATSHLFFAYLRSLAPRRGITSFAMLPMSLQKLLQETEYPPQRPILLQSTTNKVVMIVDAVSPTPFALLRRGSHFEYRDEDRALREFSDYEDPLLALTDECRRVLKAISAANQTQAVSSSKHSTSLRDASWSRFEDIGFGSLLEEDEDEDPAPSTLAARRNRALRSNPTSEGDGLARPTTPSWADFLSSGFVDDGVTGPTNMLLPPDKILPPIDAAVRQRSSQSHRPRLETERSLEPGELASISRFELDDAFWWVWMTSLAPEETPGRKSAFGRCAVIETRIRTGRWIVMEEIVKGAAAEPEPGAYIAEKKGLFSWARRNKGVSRSKSMGKHALEKSNHGQNLLVPGSALGAGKTSIGPDQQAKIQAAAQRLQARQKLEQRDQTHADPTKRGRVESTVTEKTNSVFTLQPVIASEASPALKWASKYDKEAIREAYLSNATAGRGSPASLSTPAVHLNGVQASMSANDLTSPVPSANLGSGRKPVPDLPQEEAKLSGSLATMSKTMSALPPLKSTDDSGDLGFAEKPYRLADTPTSPHPADRDEPSGRASPMVPPKDAPVKPEASRAVVASPSQGVETSPESKKSGKRLHKDVKEDKMASSPPPSGSGLRKLFNRKNRQSKLPENAATDVNALLASSAAVGTSLPDPTPKPTTAANPISEPTTEPTVPEQRYAVSSTALAPASVPEPDVSSFSPPAAAPITTLEENAEPPRTPTVDQPIFDAPTQSPPDVDGFSEAQNAAREFARFDQGPLVEQPAFVPDDSDTEVDDAIPPPIARQRSSLSPSPTPVSPIEESGSVVPVSDRWAQIRKNAAERAAQRQIEEPIPKHSKTTDGDDDTSGEETIESRVARIKARVAELTGNMEGVAPPGGRTLPVRRAM